MPQYLATKADAKVRHIRRSCSALKTLIDDESVDFTKDDIVPMSKEQLEAHRKEFGNGDGTDGKPVEAGRCPVCWNETNGRTSTTPNQREAARRARIAERVAKAASKEPAKEKPAKEKSTPVASSEPTKGKVRGPVTKQKVAA
jgi:hypothetical protein